MSEANSDNTSFNSNNDVEFAVAEDNNQIEFQDSALVSENRLENISDLSNATSFRDDALSNNSSKSECQDSLEQKMNWQKVAHKLREYNRKLLKKVFRIEQELADSNHKFNKLIEKSRNSDLLIAQQAERIEICQEKISELNLQTAQKLSASQQVVDDQKVVINDLFQKFEQSQQHTAQLERECVLLKEDCNSKTYELNTKDKEIKDLKVKLSQQQRCAIQYKAELKRHSEKTASSSKDNQELNRSKDKQSNRSIQPWNNYAVPETKISLPQTKAKKTAVNNFVQASETIETAAEIATWSAVSASRKKVPQSPSKSFRSNKPQSLAAVDLPTFPKPQ